MRRQLMKCPHGRTARHGCTHCNPQKVTDTGRAITPGRVTRASSLVRTKHRRQSAPLPGHLQCHPVALAPTSKNPACYSSHRQYGLAQKLMNEWTREDLLNGRDLLTSADGGRFEIVWNLETVGWTNIPQLALAYEMAGKVLGLEFEVIDNG